MNESLYWLIQLTKKNNLRIILIAFLQSFLNLSGLIYAILFRNLLDFAVDGSSLMIRKYIFVFLSVLLIQGSINAVLRTLKENTSIIIENSLKTKCMNNILFREYERISNTHTGEWMNKLSNDTVIVARNSVNLFPNVCGIIVQISAALIVLVRIVPDFMLFLFVLIAVALAFELFFYKRIKVLHKNVQEKDGRLRIFIQECLNSLTVIKSFSKEKEMMHKLDSYLYEYKDAVKYRVRFSVVMNFFFGTGINSALILSGLYCAYAILNNRISYGTFVAVIQIISFLRTPISGAYSNIPNYYSMLGSIERLRKPEEYLEDKYEYMNDSELSFDSISFRDVCFTYQDDRNNHTINDLSFDIKNGDFIGISGPSGCGKSSLLKLMLCLYRPSKGEITVNGKGSKTDLHNYHRCLFAYVPQDNQLMKGSIKDVICLGEKYEEKKMDRVLKISCCDEFIKNLPLGIETKLSEKGSGLSEGQMQRIGIARALYSERPILLLDEVTSALNEELEIEILKNLRDLKEKTVLLITHRKNTLNMVDKILKCEVEDGAAKWEMVER